VRILLAALLAVALAVVVAAPGRVAPAIALLVLVLAYLHGSAKLAIDLIELIPVELAADAALLVALALALTRVTAGGRLLIGALIAVALATQTVPLIKRVR
jgi:hypothetical protein